MPRFYTTLTWDNWPEGGSYGVVVDAVDTEEAETLARQEMADSRADEDITAEDMLRIYGDDWHVVDCYDLDEHITSHIGLETIVAQGFFHDEFPLFVGINEIGTEGHDEVTLGGLIAAANKMSMELTVITEKSDSMIGSKWRHIKRCSEYVVKEIIPHISGMSCIPDGTISENVEVGANAYKDVMIQRSLPHDGSDWWLYQNEEGMNFLRPASEFTPNRFTRIGE